MKAIVSRIFVGVALQGILKINLKMYYNYIEVFEVFILLKAVEGTGDYQFPAEVTLKNMDK